MIPRGTPGMRAIVATRRCWYAELVATRRAIV